VNFTLSLSPYFFLSFPPLSASVYGSRFLTFVSTARPAPRPIMYRVIYCVYIYLPSTHLAAAYTGLMRYRYLLLHHIQSILSDGKRSLYIYAYSSCDATWCVWYEIQIKYGTHTDTHMYINSIVRVRGSGRPRTRIPNVIRKITRANIQFACALFGVVRKSGYSILYIYNIYIYLGCGGGGVSGVVTHIPVQLPWLPQSRVRYSRHSRKCFCRPDLRANF